MQNKTKYLSHTSGRARRSHESSFKTLHNTAKSNDGKKLTKAECQNYCPPADFAVAKEKGEHDSSRLCNG